MVGGEAGKWAGVGMCLGQCIIANALGFYSQLDRKPSRVSSGKVARPGLLNQNIFIVVRETTPQRNRESSREMCGHLWEPTLVSSEEW